jgi:hypothetical protein
LLIPPNKGGWHKKKGEHMYDIDRYHPSKYRELLLNIANNVLEQYNEKDRGVTDVQSAKNTFNVYVYCQNKKVVQDKNYETILDDLLLTIDEEIQNNITPLPTNVAGE